MVQEIRAAGGEAIGQVCDVTDAKSVASLVRATEQKFGGVQVLVNNAALFGKIAMKPFMEITSEEWDRVMTVNTRGSFECVKAVFPVMQRQGYGKIINIASGTVFKGTPLMAHYVSSKGAIIGMTRALSRELGDHGIRINALAPGLTLSEVVKGRNDYGALRTANIASRCLEARGGARRSGRRAHLPCLPRQRLHDRPDHGGRWRLGDALGDAAGGAGRPINCSAGRRMKVRIARNGNGAFDG